jgi:hypothetical protein
VCFVLCCSKSVCFLLGLCVEGPSLPCLKHQLNAPCGVMCCPPPFLHTHTPLPPPPPPQMSSSSGWVWCWSVRTRSAVRSGAATFCCAPSRTRPLCLRRGRRSLCLAAVSGVVGCAGAVAVCLWGCGRGRVCRGGSGGGVCLAAVVRGGLSREGVCL